MDLNDINTPAPLIDLDIMERNIGKMGEYFRGKRCHYRAHVKTHKSPFIAHKQLKAGAVGVACQTIDEAEVMVESGIGDILITHMIVTPCKIRRLVNLCKHAAVAVTVDNSENVKSLASAARQTEIKLSVVIDLNVGQNRAGLAPMKPVLELAQLITGLEGIHLGGIMGYEGHLVDDPVPFEERKRKVSRALTPLVETKNLLLDSSIQVETTTAGGTGTYNITSEIDGVTEVQAGSYVLMDRLYRAIETCGSDFGCALTLLTTVVSRPTRNRAVVDLGWKACSIEYGMPEPKELRDVRYETSSDEHGILTPTQPDAELKGLDIGTRVQILPSHCDTTMNLHDKFYGVRNGKVELVCPILGRRRS